MIKLQAATCPKCGANIEVNEQLEKTICQYCGTTILVSDAVEKYKVELSGKVKVEGIKNRDDYFSQALKHIDVEEYDEAKECLYTIVDDDSFDIEAYYELARVNYLICKDYNSYASANSNFYDDYCQKSLQELHSVYERLEKIDKSGSFESKTADYKKVLDQDNQNKEEMRRAAEITPKLLSDINSFFNQAERIDPDDGDTAMWDTFSECLGVRREICFMGGGGNGLEKSLYWFQNFESISFDLVIKAKFYRYNSSDEFNPSHLFYYYRPDEAVQSCEELKRRHELFVTKANETLTIVKKNKTKKKLKKAIKRIAIIIGIVLILYYIGTH